MIRWMLALAALLAAAAALDTIDESLLEQIFGINIDEEDNEAEPGQCESLGGKGPGCYECRYCNDSLVQASRYSTARVQLQLKDLSCMEEQTLCCVVQKDILGLRSTENCGKSNPDGVPRRRRAAARAVLQGEFPWRAWVYKKNSATPLCAATFVQDNPDYEALLTLASCVHGVSAGSLEVAFARGGARSAVRDVIAHEGYVPGKEANNIAILRLRSAEALPAWAAPACLPPAAPGHAAPCLTTSDTDIRVNTVIPLRKACRADGSAPPPSLTCAAAPDGDYAPERAAGLYCKEQFVKRPAYIVHGLATARHDGAVRDYVSVWHFSRWLDDKLEV